MNDVSKNYYEVLEVPTNATFDDIQLAYQKSRGAYTGDSIALYSLLSQEEANKILELIEEAYSILSDPVKRQQYNEARGIVTEESKESENVSISEAIANADVRLDKAAVNKAPGDMNKLVAQNKYGLEYSADPAMEKEIEQCTEFTGEFLKRVREYKNVDIPRLAEMTKISKTYIRYIEDEEVNKMPAMVYVRGFVYQYAKCLKLNPDLVANSFLYRLKKLKGEA